MVATTGFQGSGVIPRRPVRLEFRTTAPHAPVLGVWEFPSIIALHMFLTRGNKIKLASVWIKYGFG